MPSVLFVCLGNICRSPAAQGILGHLADQRDLPFPLHIESCGLGDWHAGRLPDERMRKAAQTRGIALTSRAQAFDLPFFETFDYILAADRNVFYELHSWTDRPEHKAKIHLMTAFSPTYKDKEIPDPYYGEEGHFELVLDMLEDSCMGLLNHLAAKNDTNFL